MPFLYSYNRAETAESGGRCWPSQRRAGDEFSATLSSVYALSANDFFALRLPDDWGAISHGDPHVRCIHFCFQSLHLWVTASRQDFVYRELIPKYFGTEMSDVTKANDFCDSTAVVFDS